MANFNFGTSIPVGFNFYFGTTYTGTETVFNFIIGGYGYGVYNFNFGAIGIKQLVIKSTATPGYVINSINVENLEGEDVLYINTVSGIVRMFSSSCSGTIDNRNIVSSDYESGICGAEKICAGYDNILLEIDTLSGTSVPFLLDGVISKVLYYVW